MIWLFGGFGMVVGRVRIVIVIFVSFLVFWFGLGVF